MRDTPLCKGFSSEGFEQFIRTLGDLKLGCKEVLFESGSIAAAMFIIRTGEIEFYTEKPGSPPEMIGVLGEGEVIGEMSIVRSVPRSVSARAKVDCVLFSITTTQVEKLRSTNPVLWGDFVFNIACLLCSRLETANQRLFSSMKPSVATPPAARGLWSLLTGR